jgi:hypothetical protein
MAVADVVVKQEALGAVDLEERICELCKLNPKGISDQIILQDMPGIPPQQRVTAINRLLSIVSELLTILTRHYNLLLPYRSFLLIPLKFFLRTSKAYVLLIFCVYIYKHENKHTRLYYLLLIGWSPCGEKWKYLYNIVYTLFISHQGRLELLRSGSQLLYRYKDVQAAQ